MKNWILQGDYTQHVVIRAQGNTLEEAVKNAESGKCQIVDFCPDLYSSFEWDEDEESVEQLDETDWSS